MASIGYVEAMNNYSSSQMTQNGIEHGTRQIQNGEQKQKDLNKLLEDKKKELAQLQDEITQMAKDQSFGKTVAGLFGNDCGMSDKQHQVETMQAQMQKTMDQLKSTEAQIDMLLQQVQGYQQDGVDALNDNQKTRDESDKSAREAAGG